MTTMLPHPVEGTYTVEDNPPVRVRVIGYRDRVGGVDDRGDWLILDSDGRPTWADFHEVRLSPWQVPL